MQKLSLAMTLSIFALTAACGKGYAQEEGHRVALVLGVKGSPFYQALQCGAQAKAVALGLNLTVSAPDQFAADSQIPVVNAVGATNPDVAAIVPTDTQALIAPMRQLNDRGTKVITVDQSINDISFLQTQILTDNEAGGKMAAIEMDTLLGGEGKVLVITQPPGSTAQDARVAGFEQQLKNYPNIIYLGSQYQSDDPQRAAEIVTSTLSAHPDLAGIFSSNDQGAIGAITGLRQARAAGRIKVVAYDAATAQVNAFKNGDIHVLIAQNPRQEGEMAMEIAVKLMRGEPVSPLTMAPIVSIKDGDIALAETHEYKADCL